MNEYVKVLTAPLNGEDVETVTNFSDRSITEVVNIGERVTSFENVLDTEAAILEELWGQWEDLQNEYLEHGVDVFGPEKFEEAEGMVKGKGKGFRREMELIQMEFDTATGELMEEIAGLGKTYMQKMKASEKVRIKWPWRTLLTCDRIWIISSEKSRKKKFIYLAMENYLTYWELILMSATSMKELPISLNLTTALETMIAIVTELMFII